MKLLFFIKSVLLPLMIFCQIFIICFQKDKYVDDKIISLLTQNACQGSLAGVLESDYSRPGKYKRVKIGDAVFTTDQFTYYVSRHINFWLISPYQKYSGEKVFWFYNRKFKMSDYGNSQITEKILFYRSLGMKKLRLLLKKQRKKSAGLIMALWTGEKSLLSRLFSNAMKQAGASHILALSGLHTGILALYLSWLMKPVRSAVIRNIITAIFLCAFLFVSGFSASLTRAVLFWFLVSIKKHKIMSLSSLKILMICVLVQLSVKPEHLTEISFQLSYLSLTGILLFTDVPLLFLSGRSAEKITELFSASLGALLFTAPVVCLYWGSLNINSMFSSLVLIPLCSLFYGLSIPVLLLLGAGFSNAVLFPLEILYTLMYKSARLLTLFGAIELQLYQLLTGYAVIFIASGGYLYFKRIRIQTEPRLHIRDQNSAGYDGAGPPEKMGSEFPY